MLFSSHRIIHKKKLTPGAKRALDKHANDIWLKYYAIFNENNKKERKAFFSDQIIQFLWPKFYQKNEAQIIEYLQKFKETSMNPIKKQMFYKDVIDMEVATGCQIIPVSLKGKIWLKFETSLSVAFRSVLMCNFGHCNFNKKKQTFRIE